MTDCGPIKRTESVGRIQLNLNAGVANSLEDKSVGAHWMPFWLTRGVLVKMLV